MHVERIPDLTRLNRPLLVVGSLVQAVTYFGIGGMGTRPNPGDGTKIAITALFTLYYLGFVTGWAPIYHIITSEVPNSRTSTSHQLWSFH